MKSYSKYDALICDGGRAPQGAGGLKYNARLQELHIAGRAPQGARGLKLMKQGRFKVSRKSRPARGAWIEMLMTCVAVAMLV